MDRQGYQELYAKQPKDILTHIKDDMTNILGYTDIDGNMLDKLTEWKYMISKAIDKL